MSDRVLDVVAPPHRAGDVDVTVTTPAGGSTPSARSRYRYENTRPEAAATTVTVNRGGTVDVDLTALDDDGDPVTFAVVGEPETGELRWIDDDTLRYRAAAVPGTQRLVFAAHDGTEAAVGTVTFHVANRAPVAVADAVTVANDEPTSIRLDDLLANDTDPDGDDLTMVAAFAVVGTVGQVALTDSAVVYTPQPEFTGATTMRYVIGDNHGRSAVGTVTIDVRDRWGIRQRIDAERDRLASASSPDRRIARAVQALDRALDDGNWKTDDTLTMRGGRAFTGVQVAVAHLGQLTRDDAAAPDDVALAKKVTVALVRAARDLASVAIAAAEAAQLPERTTVARDAAVTAAKERRSRGDEAASQGQPTRAVGHYRQAWRFVGPFDNDPACALAADKGERCGGRAPCVLRTSCPSNLRPGMAT